MESRSKETSKEIRIHRITEEQLRAVVWQKLITQKIQHKISLYIISTVRRSQIIYFYIAYSEIRNRIPNIRVIGP